MCFLVSYIKRTVRQFFVARKWTEGKGRVEIGRNMKFGAYAGVSFIITLCAVLHAWHTRYDTRVGIFSKLL